MLGEAELRKKIRFYVAKGIQIKYIWLLRDNDA